MCCGILTYMEKSRKDVTQPLQKQKELFYRQFDYYLKQEETKNIHMFSTGRRHFTLSIAVAITANIIVMLMLEQLNVTTTLLNTLGVFSLISMIWFQHVVSNKNTKYYIKQLRDTDYNAELFLNKIFRASKLNLKYENQSINSGLNAHIEALDIFKNENVQPKYQCFNKLCGVGIYGQWFDMYNLSVTDSKNTRLKIFSGSLCIKKINAPDNYYLRITPKSLIQDYKQDRINYINSETIRLDAEQAERFAPPDFDVSTNDMDHTDRIIRQTGVSAYFKTLYTSATLNQSDIHNADAINMIHDMSRSLKEQRVEMLIIKNGVMYLFMPFRNLLKHQKHPFDIKMNRKINPDLLWQDIDDALQKSEIMSRIAKTQSKKE